jgi:hypothetical protein
MHFLVGLVAGRIMQWVLWGVLFKLVAALGVGFAIYTGLEVLVDSAEAEIMAQLSGAAANVVAVIGMLRIDQAITILFSAIGVRLTLNAFGGVRKILFGTASAA